MGYEVHITRKASWHDDEGPVISLDDWLGYVASDADSIVIGRKAARRRGRAVWFRWRVCTGRTERGGCPFVDGSG